MGPKAFVDMASLPEDDRVAFIAASARAGERVAVFVDDGAIADRYVQKILAAGGVRLIRRVGWGVGPIVLLSFGPVPS